MVPNPLLKAFQYIWFAWSVFIFLTTGILALACYVLIFNLCSSKRANYYTFWVTRYWGKSILAAMLVRVSTEGLDFYEQNKSYVLVCNHTSITDIMVTMAVSPVAFSFLAKKEADKIPIVGYLARNMHVYVNRSSAFGRKESFERMYAHVKQGRSILIFPEGSRNRSTAPLGKLYNGAFRLAAESETDLGILTICGAGKIDNPNRPFRSMPGYIHCVFSQPITTKGKTQDELKYYTEQTMNKVLKGYKEGLVLS